MVVADYGETEMAAYSETPISEPDVALGENEVDEEVADGSFLDRCSKTVAETSK